MIYNLRINLFFILALVLSYQGFAQDFSSRSGEVFDHRKYPADSFSVRKNVTIMGQTKVVLTALIYDYTGLDDRGFQLWLEVQKNGKIIKSKFLGGPEGENDYRFFPGQPLKDFFILDQGDEFTGVYHLISKEGIWYEIPGGGIIMNKARNMLYTDVPVECGGCQISKFSLHSRKLTTKLWDGNGIAWKEFKNEADYIKLFEQSELITWETIKKFH